MSFEVVIRAQDVGKAYRIFKRPQDRLKQMLWRGRRKFFEEYWALQGATFEALRGETIGIIGRNGAGKSTLLQLICGTLQPSAGTIEVDGRVAALLELGAGFNPEFTGHENVYLSASVLGLSEVQINERYQQIIDFAGLGDFINQPVKLYSSGMYARLAFAICAHVDADILIVDEILAVGDVAFTQKCMRFIHEFKKRGTLLFVSHDMTSVTSLCDRAIWLDSGTVREMGLTKEVCHNYLASVNEEKDNLSTFKIGGSRRTPYPAAQLRTDHRHEILQQSPYKNDIELFKFDPESNWFGHRGAEIEEAVLQSPDGQPLKTLEGGGEVVIRINCRAEEALDKPIVGFFIKNRLGQHLFGDNTYITYSNLDFPVAPGQRFAASFRFQMPYLPSGDYSVLVSIADGTQTAHRHHHWIDDAIFFHVHSSHVAQGLIGIPMLEIALDYEETSREKLASPH